MLKRIVDAQEETLPNSKRLQLILLILILGLAAWLRLHHLDRTCLWVDEANTYLIAKAPLSMIPQKLAYDSSPPLYYFFLNLWMGLFNHSLFAMRLISTVFSLSLILILYLASKKLFGPRAAIHIAFVYAFSPVQVFYSQQLRMYTLLPLLCFLSTMALLLCFQKMNPPRLAGYIILTLLAVLTHNFALYLLGFHCLLILCSKTFKRNIKAWFSAWLGIGILYSPWLPIFWRQLKAPDTYVWFDKVWNEWFFYTPLVNTFYSFAPSGHIAEFSGPLLRALKQSGSICYLLLAMLGVWIAYKKPLVPSLSGRMWAPAFILCFIAQGLFVSWILVPNYVPGRTDQAFFPAYALLVGLGLSSIPWRILRIGGLGVILFMCVYAVNFYHTVEIPKEYKGDDQALARDIGARMEEGDVMLCTSLSRAPLAYYLREIKTFSYPRRTRKQLGGQDDAALLQRGNWLKKEANDLLKEIRQSMGNSGRIFLVHVKSPVNSSLMERIEDGDDIRSLKILGKYKQRGTALDMTLIEFKWATH